jgi:type IV secretory pathway VirB4 component
MPNNFANSQDLVDIKEIRQNTIILRSGALRQVLLVGGINFSLKSDNEQGIITQAYQDFLNSIDFPLQIIIHSRKINIEHYLQSLEDRRQQEASTLLQDQITEYADFIRKFVSDNAIMSKTFLVVVPFAPVGMPTKESVTSAIPFFKKKKPDAAAQQVHEADFEHSVAQLKQRVDRVAEGLTGIGLEPLVLNDEQLIELLYNFYNPETVEREKITLPDSKPADTHNNA